MSVDPHSAPPPQSSYFHARYDPIEIIGSGGFGYVLKARKVGCTEGRHYAIKLILKQRVTDGMLVRAQWEDSDGLVRCPVPAEVRPAKEGETWAIVPTEALVLRRSARLNGVVSFIELFACADYFYLVQDHFGKSWRKKGTEDASYRCPPTPPLTPTSPTISLGSPPFLARRSPSFQSLAFTPATPPPQATSLPMLRRSSSSDLFECIEEHNHFAPSFARFVFCQVLDVVTALRARGICHRDIKDENIVIDEQGIVKLIDFGSALLFDVSKPMGLTNRFYGTSTSAPPEVIAKQPFDVFAAEIFSLGILLHLLLTGSNPFPSTRDALIGRRINTTGVVLSADVDDLLSRMLAVDPQHRINLTEVWQHPWLRQS